MRLHGARWPVRPALLALLRRSSLRSLLAPDHQCRIDEQLQLLERALPLLRNRRVPYYAHVRIRGTAGRQTDLLLGEETRVRAGLALVDWRTAPLAEVFFGFTEGEEYAIEAAGRTLDGVVVRRNLVAFDAGELVEITTPEITLSRRGGGAWRAVEPISGPRVRVAASDGRRRPVSPVDVELDAAQRRVVDLPRGRAVLVLGEAGCGKTVVALHRLARLRRAAGEKLRAAVVVPTEGLRALVESLVERLGLSGVKVQLYDRFAADQARRCFPDLPRRESQNATAGVVQLKRHPALRTVLAELARRGPAKADEDCSGRRSRALARRADLHELFGDRLRVNEVVDRSEGSLIGSTVAEVLEHTRVQFNLTAEEEYAHVFEEARQTVDQRAIDEGTPMEDAATVDVEDYAVMFELDRLRAAARGGRAAAPRRYDCLVLDEAQELAPLELALLGRSLAPGGTLVVAGDAEQQIDPTSCFRGWTEAMENLGAAEHQAVVLEVSYRCPPEVVVWARGLRQESGAGASSPEGPATFPDFGRFESECHLAAWLIDELRLLEAQDHGASAAVVCRTAAAAGQLERSLRHGLTVHLALGGRFTFRPGVQVTCVDEVKGLEFDYVFIPDATTAAYPDTAGSRRALYVAATRAVRQLLVAAAGEPSRLISRGCWQPDSVGRS